MSVKRTFSIVVLISVVVVLLHCIYIDNISKNILEDIQPGELIKEVIGRHGAPTTEVMSVNNGQNNYYEYSFPCIVDGNYWVERNRVLTLMGIKISGFDCSNNIRITTDINGVVLNAKSFDYPIDSIP